MNEIIINSPYLYGIVENTLTGSITSQKYHNEVFNEYGKAIKFIEERMNNIRNELSKRHIHVNIDKDKLFMDYYDKNGIMTVKSYYIKTLVIQL